MVQQSSHRTPNERSGAVFIVVNMWIFFDFIYSHASVNVSTCMDSIVLPSGSLSDMVCLHLSGGILVYDLLTKFVFWPQFRYFEVGIKSIIKWSLDIIG